MSSAHVAAATEVLLIDDDPHLRQALSQTLDLAGLKVQALGDARGLAEALPADWPGVVVSDIRMPGLDGLQLLDQLHGRDAELPVLLITGHGDVPLAVQAMRAGAWDFLEKPFPSDTLLDSVRRALAVRRLVLENRQLRQALSGRDALEGRLIGLSPEIVRLRQQVAALARTQADVLILGETGSGKEVVARALHDLSSRRDGPFVAINAGALAESVVESELFGHEAGAFTGAQKRRIGKFEFANGGTLFLDEIESMSLEVQVKLLRLLQERAVERLGSNQLIPLDIRVIAATKEDLRQAADQGRFRADLYYRLNVAPLRIPPLRERGEDILLLFQHYADTAAARHGLPPRKTFGHVSTAVVTNVTTLMTLCSGCHSATLQATGATTFVNVFKDVTKHINGSGDSNSHPFPYTGGSPQHKADAGTTWSACSSCHTTTGTGTLTAYATWVTSGHPTKVAPACSVCHIGGLANGKCSQCHGVAADDGTAFAGQPGVAGSNVFPNVSGCFIQWLDQ